MNAIELNSCAGGMALGARSAGIEFALSVDWDADACETYERALGHRPLQLDIRELARLVAAGWRPVSVLDLLVADPPCTPWSRAGNRLGVEDDRDLLHVTVELVRALHPRCWIIANIPGLDDGPNWPTVHATIGSLQDLYAIDFRRLDATDFGVPQHRVRPFWFGRPHGTTPLAWPASTHGDPNEIGHAMLGDGRRPWVTCGEALAHLPESELGRPVRVRQRVDGNGGALLEWPWDRPATTVTARDEIGQPGRNGRDGTSQSTNAIKLSERAALILQGFPDGYWIAGKTKKARWSQIGQAMPPPLSAAVFNSIAAWMVTEQTFARTCVVELLP